MLRKEEGAGFCPGEALARDCLSMLDVDAEAAINQWPPPMLLSIIRPLTTPLLPGRELVVKLGGRGF